MYNNQYLKAFFTLKKIKQSDIAKLLEKSTSTIRRKNDDLGFTQKEILLIHEKYDIPIEAFSMTVPMKRISKNSYRNLKNNFS